MDNMADDVGEGLFGRYVAARGYAVLGRDVDLGTPKRPDFLIQAGAHEVVVEVKTFDPPTIPHSARHSGFVRRDLGPVRSRIGAGAKQLRRISGRPLVVLLTSPLDPFVPLSYMDVMEAMYGDLVMAYDEEGPLNAYLGRNAKLRIVEPDGSLYGDHAHLSAVAVLRCAPAMERRIAVWLRDNIGRYRTDLEAFVDALHHAEDQADHEDMVYLDVFETVSAAAVPLPRDLFNGPHDGRWGETAPGRYGRLVSSSREARTTTA